MESRSVFGELKRRRVFRVAIVYAIVAWIVIQVASTAFPHLALPAWTITFVIVAALAAFPIALVLAWAFDLTPEGVKRAEPAGSSEPAASGEDGRRARVGSRRRLMWLGIVAASLLGAVGMATWLAERSGYLWQNPLSEAHFTRLTDLDGAEQHAAISRDGRFVAFLSEHEGPFDIWVGQLPSGEFHNLTRGRVPELGNDRVRNLGFSPDGSLVHFWVRPGGSGDDAGPRVWAVPTLGGDVRPYFEAAELDWSPDGSRIAYHTDAPGDPIFVTEPGAGLAVGREVFVAAPGVHNHYPVWSSDGRFIYFVSGHPPDEMDIWRIRPTGGEPERITFHNSTVSHPTPLDGRKLLYLATAEDGSGPWIHEVDVRRRTSRRVSFGLEQYTSLAVGEGGRRLVATVANPKGGLWRVPIEDHPVDASRAARIPLPTARGLSPRLGPDYLLYLSSRGGPEGIWKLREGDATELWSGLNGRVVAAPTIAPDGGRIAFPVLRGGKVRLHVMNADGTGVRRLADSLEVRGAPAWSPDGQWIALAGDEGGGLRLFRIPLLGAAPLALTDDYGIDPVWSPDGRLLAYAGADVGPAFPVRAVALDGSPLSWPALRLPRGTRRVAFLPGRRALVVLQGDVWRPQFWLIDLETGVERQLTELGPQFRIGDFDIAPDGREIVFGRQEDNSDIVLIELPAR